MSAQGQSGGWRRAAACQGIDPGLFFPSRGESVAEAKEVCAGCVVTTECARYALDSGQRFGIWGGLTERERRRLRSSLRAAIVAGEVSAA